MSRDKNTEQRAAFTLPEVARSSGVEYRTLHMWFRRGLFPASVATSTGTGHPNLFSLADLDFVRWLKSLRDLGLGVDGLHRAVKDPRPIVYALQAKPRKVP